MNKKTNKHPVRRKTHRANIHYGRRQTHKKHGRRTHKRGGVRKKEIEKRKKEIEDKLLQLSKNISTIFSKSKTEAESSSPVSYKSSHDEQSQRAVTIKPSNQPILPNPPESSKPPKPPRTSILSKSFKPPKPPRPYIVENKELKKYLQEWVVKNIDNISWSNFINIRHPYVLKIIEIMQNDQRLISKYTKTHIYNDIFDSLYNLKIISAAKDKKNLKLKASLFFEIKDKNNLIEELIKELKQQDYTRVKSLQFLMFQELKNEFQEKRVKINLKIIESLLEKNISYNEELKKHEKLKENLIYDIYIDELQNSNYWYILASDTSNHSYEIIDLLIPKLIKKEAEDRVEEKAETDADKKEKIKDKVDSENDSKRLIIEGLLKNKNPKMFLLFENIYKKEKYEEFFKDQIIYLKLDLGLELDSDELKRKSESGFKIHNLYNYSAEVFGNPNIFNEKGELKKIIQKWFDNIIVKKDPNLYKIMVQYLSRNPNQHIHDFLIKNNIEIIWEYMSGNEAIFKKGRCEASIYDYILKEYQYDYPTSLTKTELLIKDITNPDGKFNGIFDIIKPEDKLYYNKYKNIVHDNNELLKTILSNDYGIYLLKNKYTETDLTEIDKIFISIRFDALLIDKEEVINVIPYRDLLKDYGFSFFHPDSFLDTTLDTTKDEEERKEIEIMKEKIESNTPELDKFNEDYGCFFEVTPGYTEKQRTIIESQKRLMKPTR